MESVQEAAGGHPKPPATAKSLDFSRL